MSGMGQINVGEVLAELATLREKLVEAERVWACETCGNTNEFHEQIHYSENGDPISEQRCLECDSCETGPLTEVFGNVVGMLGDANVRLDSIHRVLDGETVESEDETVRRVVFLYNSMKWVGENYGHILVGMALEAKEKDTTDAK